MKLFDEKNDGLLKLSKNVLTTCVLSHTTDLTEILFGQLTARFNEKVFITDKGYCYDWTLRPWPTSGKVCFQVKSEGIAALALSPERDPPAGTLVYEMELGFSNNQLTVLRRGMHGGNIAVESTPDILDCDEFRTFCLEASGPHITLTALGDPKPILDYVDEERPEVMYQYIGFAGGYDFKVWWRWPEDMVPDYEIPKDGQEIINLPPQPPVGADKCLETSPPCGDNGVCYEDHSLSSGFRCECTNNYRGERCDEKPSGSNPEEPAKPPPRPQDPCRPNNPCKNGGVCSSTGVSKYTCACVNGYSGDNCEQEPDPCQPNNPCLNDGVCRSIGGGQYTCECVNGYMGDNCEEEPDPCQPNNPCQNGGICKSTGGEQYTCQCVNGYTGAFCEEEPDPCRPNNPCKNGGVCSSTGVSKYTCACVNGYSGDNCEQEPGSIIVITEDIEETDFPSIPPLTPDGLYEICIRVNPEEAVFVGIYKSRADADQNLAMYDLTFESGEPATVKSQGQPVGAEVSWSGSLSFCIEISDQISVYPKEPGALPWWTLPKPDDVKHIEIGFASSITTTWTIIPTYKPPSGSEPEVPEPKPERPKEPPSGSEPEVPEPIPERPKVCPVLDCLFPCPKGLKKDENGCDTCECKGKVDNRRKCPAVPGGVARICEERCAADNNCEKQHKCCSNGCGHVCIKACKPLKCKKACELGYVRNRKGCEICKCREPFQERPIPDKAPPQEPPAGSEPEVPEPKPERPKEPPAGSEPEVPEPIPERPNVCPQVRCAYPCPKGFKKDENGCGTCECKGKVDHRGKCPAVPMDVAGICEERCAADNNCEKQHKCCSNGCGHICIKACRSLKCKKACELGFKTNQKGCKICQCKEPPAGSEPVVPEPKPERPKEPPAGSEPEVPEPKPERPKECKPFKCKKACKFGYKTNKRGCKICRCEEPPAGSEPEVPEPKPERPRECKPFKCKKACQFGYKTNKRGCKICRCEEPPAGSEPEVPEPKPERPKEPPAGSEPEVPEPKPERPKECKPFKCKKACKFGYKTNKRGCKICRCEEPPAGSEPEVPEPIPERPKECKPFKCKKACQFGYKTNKRGCKICRCEEPPAGSEPEVPEPKPERPKEPPAGSEPEVPEPKPERPKECKPFKCKKACQFGYKTNKRGCKICRCEEPPAGSEPEVPEPKPERPKECKPFKCKKACQFGYKTNKRGCKICRCEEPPAGSEPEVPEPKPERPKEPPAGSAPEVPEPKPERPKACPEPECDVDCADGFEMDAEGCQTCDCVYIPEEVEGEQQPEDVYGTVLTTTGGTKEIVISTEVDTTQEQEFTIDLSDPVEFLLVSTEGTLGIVVVKNYVEIVTSSGKTLKSVKLPSWCLRQPELTFSVSFFTTGFKLLIITTSGEERVLTKYVKSNKRKFSCRALKVRSKGTKKCKVKYRHKRRKGKRGKRGKKGKKEKNRPKKNRPKKKKGCPEVQCAEACEEGFEMDVEGCQTCDCIEIQQGGEGGQPEDEFGTVLQTTGGSKEIVISTEVDTTQEQEFTIDRNDPVEFLLTSSEGELGIVVIKSSVEIVSSSGKTLKSVKLPSWCLVQQELTFSVSFFTTGFKLLIITTSGEERVLTKYVKSNKKKFSCRALKMRSKGTKKCKVKYRHKRRRGRRGKGGNKGKKGNRSVKKKSKGKGGKTKSGSKSRSKSAKENKGPKKSKTKGNRSLKKSKGKGGKTRSRSKSRSESAKENKGPKKSKTKGNRSLKKSKGKGGKTRSRSKSRSESAKENKGPKKSKTKGNRSLKKHKGKGGKTRSRSKSRSESAKENKGPKKSKTKGNRSLKKSKGKGGKTRSRSKSRSESAKENKGPKKSKTKGNRSLKKHKGKGGKTRSRSKSRSQSTKENKGPKKSKTKGNRSLKKSKGKGGKTRSRSKSRSESAKGNRSPKKSKGKGRKTKSRSKSDEGNRSPKKSKTKGNKSPKKSKTKGNKSPKKPKTKGNKSPKKSKTKGA
ncbi:uncharacterized protein LOC119723229 [Patiria miniata]|uniref:Uncharacterized protein n=1 Tax=Patiria miniata TaxID=46514 RepID=A0A913ZFH3_PATMI|nr:uncharacterized protein LOC119723229 [Patiria miniata]